MAPAMFSKHRSAIVLRDRRPGRRKSRRPSSGSTTMPYTSADRARLHRGLRTALLISALMWCATIGVGDRPRQRLGDRPPASAVAVKAERGAQPIEPPQHRLPAVAKLRAADDRRERELALGEDRLGVDRQPVLTPRTEHVARVEILVDEHQLALRAGELAQRLEREVQQLALHRPAGALPGALQAARPPRGLLGGRAKR